MPPLDECNNSDAICEENRKKLGRGYGQATVCDWMDAFGRECGLCIDCCDVVALQKLAGLSHRAGVFRAPGTGEPF